ncbi:MAG: hypothetical protein AAF841_10400 [Pseudomonadota bacterium]
MKRITFLAALALAAPLAGAVAGAAEAKQVDFKVEATTTAKGGAKPGIEHKIMAYWTLFRF